MTDLAARPHSVGRQCAVGYQEHRARTCGLIHVVLNNFEFGPTLDCSAPPFFRCTCQPGPGACTYLVCEDPYGQAGCPSGTPPVSPPVSPAVTPAPEPVTPSPPTPVSSSCEPDWIGNGYCDESELPYSVFRVRKGYYLCTTGSAPKNISGLRQNRICL